MPCFYIESSLIQYLASPYTLTKISCKAEATFENFVFILNEAAQSQSVLGMTPGMKDMFEFAWL